MMQSKQALERHSFFPYIAWVLIIGFSFFVYTIVQDLRQATSELENVASRLELYANTPAEEIADFER